MRVLWLAHVAATCFMVGLIWFVQIVHYPLFRQVGEAVFPAYERAHTRLTTRLVAPVMLLEAGTLLLLLYYRPVALAALPLWCSAGLLAGVWLSTACLQVPQHTILAQGFVLRAQQTLVRSNWLRTLAWSLRGLLVLGMTAELLRPLGV